MTRRQYIGALVVLAASGLLGGALSTLLIPGGAAWAQNDLPPVEDVPPADPGLSVAPKEIRAERFALVDATGRGRAALEILEEGDPAIRIFDERGKPRMILRMEHGQPQIWLADEAGRPRVDLSLDWRSDGEPCLWFIDAGGNSGLSLQERSLAIHDTENVRMLLNKDSVQLAHVTGTKIAMSMLGGEPSLMLGDTRPRARLGLLEGELSLRLWDGDGQERATFGSSKTVDRTTGATTTFPISTITLFGEDGRVQWQAP